MEDIANFENELSRTDEAADNKVLTQKPKRGRKMTMTTKDTDAMCTTIEESTTILSDNAQMSLSAKKKKRGRKSVTNQSRPDSSSNKGDSTNVVTASTSDEDEECSFANCIRPTGKNKIQTFIEIDKSICQIVFYIHWLTFISFFFCQFQKGREVDWVQCDGGCNEWFHMLCVGLVKSQMKPDDEFICKKCKSKKTTNSDKTGPNNTSSTTTTTTTTTTTNSAKKLKSQALSSNSNTATANGNSVTKKRLTRSKEEATRDKTTSNNTPIITNINENSADNSKENELRPNNSTKSEKTDKSDSPSRPKVTEKSN